MALLPYNKTISDSSDSTDVATTNTPQATSVALVNNPPVGLDPPSAFLDSTDPSGATISATSSSETVTLAGSGLVFINTYGSGVTAAFQAEIIAAENYFQSHFTNTCTLRCSFDIQQLNPNFSGQNSFGASLQHATYSQLVSALQTHATSGDDLAAVAALQRLSDPSGGRGFDIPIGEARILGLANSFSGTDDTIILNSVYWTPQALQNSPGDAIAVLEHELSEGAMGRIGSLGFWDTSWAPMDLFRFSAGGARDFTGGRDGVATYFSTDGTNVHTGLQYHNPINSSGAYDHFDFADWDSVGEDSNDHDPFGPGGPGAGDPGTLSETDLRIMDVLGWTRANLTVRRNDFNADGKSDVLLQNTNGTPQIWLMNGTSITSSSLLVNPGSTWHAAATGDVNLDGTADLIWQNTDGRPAIWEMNGTSIVGGGLLVNPGPSWHMIAASDFNGDRTADILWQNIDGAAAIWEMNGTAIVGGGVISTPAPTWKVIGAGDFNTDGHADVLWQNNDGTPLIWEMNGTTLVGSGFLVNPGSSWHAIGTGDFNGDSHDDILWQNDDGRPAIWEMNGTTIIGGGVLVNPGPSWHAISTSDFNGDGNADIIWQNNDGTPAVWEMNGTAIIGGGLLPNPGAAWQVKNDGPIPADQMNKASADGASAIPPAALYPSGPDVALGSITPSGSAGLDTSVGSDTHQSSANRPVFST